MKKKIYYFTGTGNSLKVARELSARLGEFELIPIAKYIEKNNVEISGETVGFVFPLYYQKAPKIVSDFIEKSTIDKSAYIFSVATKGVDYVGTYIKLFKKMFQKKGNKLNAGYYIIMPQNCVTHLNVPDEKTQKKQYKKADEKINKIIQAIKEKKSEYDNEPLSFFNGLTKTSFYKKNIIIHDEKYFSNSSCNGCGICMDVCPVNNIEIKNNKPVWKGNCNYCVACMNLCPKHSIQYSDKTYKFGRYKHPEISVKEIMSQKN